MNAKGLLQRLIGGLEESEGRSVLVSECVCVNLHCLNVKDGSLWRRIASQ